MSCIHIIGRSGKWLVQGEEMRFTSMDFVFNFCPVCGEHLTPEGYKIRYVKTCPVCHKPWDTKKHKKHGCGAITISNG